ncbi:MAG: hypothetical protein ACOCRZ_06345 [Halothermotrichaceae bacterium]
MKNHMNLFTYYGGDETLENNYSRALAICFKNEPLLLMGFLKDIVGADQYQSSFDTNPGEKSRISINIQQKANNIQPRENIYAVAITPDDLSHINMDNVKTNGKENPIPDIIIEVNKILIVIEVKLYKNDSAPEQLKNQIEAIITSEKYNKKIEESPVFKSYTWEKVVKLYYRAKNFLTYNEKKSNFIEDFIDYVKMHHPEWIPEKPLSKLPFTSSKEDNNHTLIYERLSTVKLGMAKQLGYDTLVEKGSRDAVPLDYKWVSEANLSLCKTEEKYNNEEEFKRYLSLTIWPGDTKNQGYHLFSFNKSYDWVKKDKINNKYPLKISPYIKFSHFYKGVFWIHFDTEKDLYKNTHNKKAYNELAGRWYRNKKSTWNELEQILENKLGSKWYKQKKGWDEHFTNSGRNYVDISLGYRVRVLIPYKKAQELDENIEKQKLSLELVNILDLLKNMINGE